MMPELATEGATSAASPFCATVIVPAFSIRAFGFPGWSNRIWPAMKFAFEMFDGVAIRLLTLTCEPFENTTPLGLTSTSAEIAGDRRGVGRVDPVQGPRAGGRLVELGALADRDVEALPVDHRAVGRLHDIELDRARIADRRAAAGDLAALR